MTLTDKDYINCLRTCNHCVKNFIESTFQRGTSRKHEYLYFIYENRLSDALQG